MTLAARGVNVLVVHPSLPVKSVKDLIALARAHPGQLNFSTAAPGTINHLAGELLKSMAKVSIVRVSYGVFVPAKTPDSIVARLHEEIVRVLHRPESRERFASVGADPVGSTPAQLAAAIKEEVARMGKVILEAGIQEK